AAHGPAAECAIAHPAHHAAGPYRAPGDQLGQAGTQRLCGIGDQLAQRARYGALGTHAPVDVAIAVHAMPLVRPAAALLAQPLVALLGVARREVRRVCGAAHGVNREMSVERPQHEIHAVVLAYQRAETPSLPT